jgi:hypothetical protein
MKSQKFIYLVLLFYCVGFWQVANAQTESKSKFSQLKFEVKSPKDKYLPLEPLQFSYKIFNPTDSPVEVYWVFPDVIFSLNVRKDDKINTPQLSSLMARKGLTIIQPNQVFEGSEVLNFQLLNIFPEYGKYELFFTIYGKELDKESNGKVVSNKVEITMQEATNINAEALDFIYKTHKTPILMGVFQYWEDKRENKNQNPLEEFVEKYSRSVYGDYAIFYLGIGYKNQKKYDLATKELNKLKDKKDFGYSCEVKSYLEEIEQDLLKIKLRENEN